MGTAVKWKQMEQRHLTEGASTRNCLKEMVARDGIEPSTRGFSVRCSTN